MNKTLLAVVIVIVVIGVVIYIYEIQGPTQSPLQGPNASSSLATTTVAASIPGWEVCNYPSFGFRFQYPQNWNVYVYSRSQGMGDIPVKEKCGDIDAGGLNTEITVAPSPDWSASLTGGMQIVAARIPQSLTGSTTTLDGQPSYTASDGSVFAKGYKISFGQNVATSTRNSILETFQFISQ